MFGRAIVTETSRWVSSKDLLYKDVRVSGEHHVCSFACSVVEYRYLDPPAMWSSNKTQRDCMRYHRVALDFMLELHLHDFLCNRPHMDRGSQFVS